MTRSMLHLPVALAVGAALAAGVTACGGDDADSSAGTSATTQERSDPTRTFTGGRTTLTLNERTRRVLDAAGVRMQPVGAARERGDRIAFPITGGTVDTRTLEGRIRHDGSLRFTAGGVELTAENLVVRPARRVLTAEVAGRRVPLFAVDFDAPDAPQDDRPLTLSAPATTLRLDALDGLGARLGVDLRHDLRIGRVDVTARS